MIVRNKYSSVLESARYFPVTGIIGPRQVGKTTLAKLLMRGIEKESIYLDLENPKDLAKLTDPVLFFTRNESKCIILDEIQRSPNLFPVLRSMVDTNRVPSRFIILGSASPDLIRDSSESLAGRIAYEELSPFNILELPGTTDINDHWFRGGFPDAFLAPSEAIRIKWLSNFIRTYIERDLPMLGLNLNPNIIRKLWTMLAHNHGNLLNLSNLSKSLEVSSTTLKKYVQFLEDAFLIRQLPPYFVNIKKRIVKSPKVYIRDTGILHYLLSILDFNALESFPVIGASWEGYVIEQIIQNMPDEYNACFYRTHQGAECDLVLVKGGKPEIAIEIKYTSTPKPRQGMIQSFIDLNTLRNFVIIPETDDYEIQKNIVVTSVKNFLSTHI